MMRHAFLRLATACVVLAAGGAAQQTVAQSTQPTQPTRPPRGAPPKPAPAPTPTPTPTNPAPANPTTPTTPTAPAATPQPSAPAPAPRKEPEVGQYIKQTMPMDLMMRIHLRVNSDNAGQKIQYRDPFTGDVVNMPEITPFEFTSVGVVFPHIVSTASSDMYAKEYKGELTVNDQLVTKEHKVRVGYPAGTQLALWSSNSDKVIVCREVELKVEIPMRCYRTEFDEASAKLLKWPTGPWPAVATAAMAPQLYVETGVDGAGQIRPYDSGPVEAALEAWYGEEGIKDPKKVPPLMLAKLITAKVWREIQITGEGLTFKARTAELAGIALQPPGYTLDTRQGSEHDGTVLLAALLKQAGIPTRTVIGWDVGEDKDKFLSKQNKANRLRSWVEFFLYDEDKNVYNWVPVDLTCLRRTSSRPAAYDKPWKFFGSNDELDRVTPFALQFHPPTDVVAYGSPGFWGWFVTPQPPKNAEQSLDFQAQRMSTRGGEEPRDPKKKDDDDKKPPKRRY